MNTTEKKAVIIGATSGIGYEVAMLLLKDGWRLGIAGRREEMLKTIRTKAPDRITTRVIDVRKENAGQELLMLIEEMGGMHLYLHSSGIGKQNFDLSSEIELDTLETNGTGFTRMVTAAFHYFSRQGKGHLAVISSIAGTKGLGIAPSYSATKRFQNTYIDALEQLACMKKIDITFTDIRPGFVATAILNDHKRYPMLMKPEKVAASIVKGLNRHKRILVIDWRYRILVCLWKLVPACIWKRLPVRN